MDGHQVTIGLDALQLFLIVINDDNVLLDLGEQLSKMSTDSTSPYDNNFHIN